MACVLDHAIIYVVKGITLDKRICDPMLIASLFGTKQMLFDTFHQLANEQLKKKFPETDLTKIMSVSLIQWLANHFNSIIPKNRKILVTNIEIIQPEGEIPLICAEIYSVKVDKTE